MSWGGAFNVSRGYTNDIENRLVGASGARTATLRYDSLGRLWQVSSPTTGTTTFLYDDDAPVAEYDSAGTLTARYVHGGSAADDPLVSYAEGTRHYLVSDHQGSIIAIADASGSAPTINTYDEYGIPAATNVGRFQYTGQAWLAELGMYYYKARTYSPTLGRFLQTDPVGYQGGINLYAYVEDDPINATDPSGTVRCVGDPRCGQVHAEAAQSQDDGIDGERPAQSPRKRGEDKSRSDARTAIADGGLSTEIRRGIGHGFQSERGRKTLWPRRRQNRRGRTRHAGQFQ